MILNIFSYVFCPFVSLLWRNVYLSLLPTKINLKWTKDLNVRAKILILLEENIKEKSFITLDLAMIFLDMIPKAQATEEK